MNLPHSGPPRSVLAVLIAAGVALVAASAYRAATYPLTHDECLSFAIFNGQPWWARTANHHLLNTWLMRASAAAFGVGELSLRLPTLAAHAAYVAATMLLLARFRGGVVLVAGYVLLNLNLFVLDFFFLARGYGLASAMTMWALYFLARAAGRDAGQKMSTDAGLATLFAALAVVANFAFLNVYLPAVAAAAWLLWRGGASRLGWASLAAVHGVFLALVVAKLLQLRRDGQLYFGGSAGFVEDTVAGLVRATLYGAAAPDGVVRAAAIAVVVAAAGAVVVAARAAVATGGRTAAAPVAFVTAVAVLMPSAQHAMLGTPFPVERAAICFIPLVTLTCLAAVSVMREGVLRTVAAGVGAAVAAVFLIHFAVRFDARTCYNWAYDAHSAEVLRLIDRDRAGGPVRLRATWYLEPSLNFYREAHGYADLAPVPREPTVSDDCEYIYASTAEAAGMGPDRVERMAAFADSATVLLRVKRPARTAGR